jgi:hypothetical protein
MICHIALILSFGVTSEDKRSPKGLFYLRLAAPVKRHQAALGFWSFAKPKQNQHRILSLAQADER